MKKYFFAALIAVTALACRKDEKPDKSPVNDARPVKLKEMVSQGLPSPYFQYTYDSNNYVTHLEHASGLLQYDLQYENGRLVRMINNTFANKDVLEYSYTTNKVTRIDIMEGGGSRTKLVELLYDEKDRLKELRWKKMQPNFNAFITRKLIFTYNQQGNISQYEDHRDLGTGLELLRTHYFDKYDNKINVEANYLIKDVFEHFLFLPQVQLQKNNPLSERIVGKQTDWSIQYSYTFNNNLPVIKTADITQTRGTETGNGARTTSTYAYY